jgi:hypothetical protein
VGPVHLLTSAALGLVVLAATRGRLGLLTDSHVAPSPAHGLAPSPAHGLAAWPAGAGGAGGAGDPGSVHALTVGHGRTRPLWQQPSTHRRRSSCPSNCPPTSTIRTAASANLQPRAGGNGTPSSPAFDEGVAPLRPARAGSPGATGTAASCVRRRLPLRSLAPLGRARAVTVQRSVCGDAPSRQALAAYTAQILR